MTDIATPLPLENYTGNRKGSYMGWLVTLESFSKVFQKTFPGLNKLYIIGQWVRIGGGLPNVLRTGRDIV